LVPEGGVVLFDDSADPHISKVLRFLRTNVPALQELDLRPYRRHVGIVHWVARQIGRVQLTGFRRVGSVDRAWDAAFHRF
jgi:hypothetical protein